MSEPFLARAYAPSFVLPQTVISVNGEGEAIALGELAGKDLLITLGITRIVEQESLDVSVSGSATGSEWEVKPLLSFPQKFYCGTYQMLLGLASRPEITHLRVQWKVNRWGRGDSKPLFEIYVAAEAMHSPGSGAA